MNITRLGELTEVSIRIDDQERVFVDFSYIPWIGRSKEKMLMLPDKLSIKLSHGGRPDIEKSLQAADLLLPENLFGKEKTQEREKLLEGRIAEFTEWGLTIDEITMISRYFSQASVSCADVENRQRLETTVDFLEEISVALRQDKDEHEPQVETQAWPPQVKQIKIRPDEDDDDY